MRVLLLYSLLAISSFWMAGCFSNPDAIYANAVRWMDEERLDRAERLLLSVLEADPKHQNAIYALGVLYLKQERLTEAQARFEEALELAPDDTEAMVNLGVLHARKNRLRKAEEMYMQALAREPANSTVTLNLARLFARQQKLRDARLLYEKILRSRPGLYAANKELAYVLKAENRYTEAMTQFTKAMRLKRDDFDLHYELGVLNFRKGNLSAGSKFLLNAVSLQESADAYLALGEIYRVGQKPREAIQAFEKAYSLQSDSYDATYKLAGLYLAEGLQHEQGSSASRKELDKAGIYVQAALEIKPDSAEAFKQAGLLRYHRGQWDQALEAFQKARNLNRYVREVHYYRGKIALKRGETEKARQAFLDELMEDPSNHKAALELGRLYLQAGEFADGVKLIKNTLSQVGENASLWDLFGDYHLQKADKENKQSGLYSALESYDEAIRAYRAVLRIDKDRLSTLEKLLSAYTSARRYAVAVPFLRQMLDLNPDALQYYSVLAMGYSANQNYARAEQVLRDYLQKKPDDAKVWFQLGKTLADKGDFEEGTVAFRKSIELQPEDGRNRMYLGMLLAELNRFEKALQSLREAVELSSEDARTRSRCEQLIAQILDVSGLSPTQNKAAKEAVDASRKRKSRRRLEPGSARYVKGMLYSVYSQIQKAWKEDRWTRSTRKKALGLIRARLIRNYRQLVKYKKFKDRKSRRIYFLGIKKLIDRVRTLKPKS